MNLFRVDIDRTQYFFVSYYVQSADTLREAAWDIAIGQSIGNPFIRNRLETDDIIRDHSCIVLEDEERLKRISEGEIKIAFPLANIDLETDGISQLLAQIIGGQTDIGQVKKCRVMDIWFPDQARRYFLGPRYGLSGIRDYTGVYDRPLLGAIIKPKVGLTKEKLLDVVKKLIDGGVNFIKEDEIMSNPTICSFRERVPYISEYLSGQKKVIYAFCINSDPLYILDRVKWVYDHGGNAVHVNLWSGLGVYKSIRDLNLPLFLFFQKSGDRVITHPQNCYGIDWRVLAYLGTISGSDMIHAGMWRGYIPGDERELLSVISTIRNNNALPSLSGGATPELVESIIEKFGVDIMISAGGSIHGHPDGTLGGARAFREAIDRCGQPSVSLG